MSVPSLLPLLFLGCLAGLLSVHGEKRKGIRKEVTLVFHSPFLVSDFLGLFLLLLFDDFVQFFESGFLLHFLAFQLLLFRSLNKQREGIKR